MGSTRLLWSIVSLLCLATLWSWIRPPAPSPQPPRPSTEAVEARTSPGLVERIETLEDELTREILLRQQLERRLAQVEQRRPGAAGQLPQTSARQSMEAPDPATSRVTARPSPPDTRRLDEKLVELGLPSDTARAIQRRLDSNQLAMLELRNQAVREGWSDSPEFVERMHEMRNASRSLREEFGDETYERYLYASGQPNRIRVREIFSGSAAEIGGLQVGDIVLNYASGNIFSMGELRNATTEGVAGENILVEVLRDGEPVSLNITRGPMGISMEMVRSEPR